MSRYCRPNRSGSPDGPRPCPAHSVVATSIHAAARMVFDSQARGRADIWIPATVRVLDDWANDFRSEERAWPDGLQLLSGCNGRPPLRPGLGHLQLRRHSDEHVLPSIIRNQLDSDRKVLRGPVKR